ncbi:GlcG/HbpS family heme-binding protein [Zobellella maritima]|uniref:GlcG/HbpS family heme-binding protein n=1 Tax=Zobellella maritima TaxID=2059725 RepID=UPI000E3064B1|nr:heme-binding protein [Zobellella maritima]
MLKEEHAQAMLKAAREHALKLGVKVNIAIVDAGAHLLAFNRMDGAMLGSIEVALKKARTAVLFPMPAEQFGEIIRHAELTGMEHTNGGLVAFAGGQPLHVDGRLLGAIGVSGANAEQDKDIAEQAIIQIMG